MSKFRQLTLDDRCTIRSGLDKKHSFKQIARDTGFDCTTIAKEVRNRRIFKKTGSIGKAFNDCKNRYECSEKYLCGNMRCNRRCCFCSKTLCIKNCPEYVMEICKAREKPPYVCNGCKKLTTCSMEKALYNAQLAQKEYKEIQRESRTGICADEQEIRRINELISPLLKKGQSIHNICVNHMSEIMHSEKSIYKYVDMSLFSAKNIDLPRKVRFRPRKSRHEGFKVDKKCRLGRTYEDYITFTTSNPNRHLVEMDTVYGKQGGKVLLTLEFVSVKFMIIVLLESCTAKEVENAINHLYDILGHELFSKLFQLILTDNGSEFSDPTAIEFYQDGLRRSFLFYCEPNMSQQKGALENNHEMIRRISPKGKSLDHLTQADVLIMMNHINSYARGILNDRTPHIMFECMFGIDALNRLGAELIDPDSVTLHPSLLK